MSNADPFQPSKPSGAPGSNGNHAPGPDWGEIQRLVTLGTLAGSIAHEFNNILTPVLSYAQLAQSSPDDRDLVQKALRKAAEGAEKAAEIASAMLGLIRDGDGIAACRVAEAVRDALGCLPKPPQKQGIGVEIEIPHSLAVRIRPVALQQILLNLILNAMQAMEGRPGTLRIFESEAPRSTWNIAPGNGRPGGNGKKPHAAPPAEDQAVIAVSDTGCGIPANEIARVFEPFRRTRRKANSSSTGLGLAITKRLVEEAGGTIAVESVISQGSTFFIALPRASAGELTTNRAA